MGAISQVKQLISQSSCRPCSVEQICNQVGISYHTLRKQFRRSEGMSLSEYYQTMRLQHAKELLSYRDIRIFEVAYDMGYTDQANFTNWFKKRTGLTPTAYRKQFFKGIVRRTS